METYNYYGDSRSVPVWINVFFSLIGYSIFGLILYSTHKKRVLKDYLHNVILILAFAMITDLMELRINFIIVYDLQDRITEAGRRRISTTLAACTVTNMFYFFHFLITYVEAFVSIHLMIFRFCGKSISVIFLYSAIGLLFAVKAAIILATLMFGEIYDASVYCTEMYMIRFPMQVSLLVWLASILVAPILSIAMLVRNCCRRQFDSGVPLFIFLSSLAMGILVASFIGVEYAQRAAWRSGNIRGMPLYGIVFVIVKLIANIIQDFRFLLLCILAVGVVSDIRRAVIATVCQGTRKILGRPEPPSTTTNEVFLESLESNEKRAVPGFTRMRDRTRELIHDATWIVSDYFIYQPWLNVVFSLLGYVLFIVIIYACKKKGMLWMRMHDILLLLSFALLTDVLETSQHILVIVKFGGGSFINTGTNYDRTRSVRISTTTCTFVSSLFYLHFLIVYVEAAISLRRIIGEKVLSARTLYIILGIIFALHAATLISALLWPDASDDMPRYAPISCSRSYSFSLLNTTSFLCTFFAMGITPILSIITIIKQLVRKQPGADITAVFLISSYSLSALLIGFIVVFLNMLFGKFLGRAEKCVHICFVALFFIQDFRFPLLCLLSTLIVSDIRSAVFSSIGGLFNSDRRKNAKNGALLGKDEIEERENDIRLDDGTITMNISDQAQWRVVDSNVFNHQWKNVIASWAGYALFALIIASCVKRRVFSRRLPDVLLILIFAFVTDLAKMRMHLYFAMNLTDDRHLQFFVLPTTIAACTMGMWIFYAHFLITYAFSFVSIYRFIVRYGGSGFAVNFVYTTIGIVVALHVSLVFESFLHGTAVEMTREMTMWCTRAYMIDGLMSISQIATAISLAVAPILSVLIMFKRSRTYDQGVTAFIFLSSLSMAVLVYHYLFSDLVPAKYRDASRLLFLATYTIQDFRFPLMCALAILLVKDIRGAVFSAASDATNMLLCRQPLLPMTLTNDNYIDLELD